MAAARRMLLFSLAFLLSLQAARAQTVAICNNTGLKEGSLYQRRPNSDYCYVLFLTRGDFSTANRTCVRNNGYLVKIDSEEENDYIRSTYLNSASEFWIGLTDQVTEGVFKWVEGDTLILPNISYTNWFGGSAVVTNEIAFDCVKFTSDGWKVHDHFCDSSVLPYLCRQQVCSSTDGVSCATMAPVVSSPLSPVIIAVIVVVVVILILVIVIIILLFCMWKYKNDAFYRYILCCVYGGSKTQINNLKQENIRLRKELSQQKLNLSSSERFQPGQLSRKNSVMSDVSGTVPLVGFDKPRAPPARAMSFASNQVRPLLTPQTSALNLKLPPKRAMSTASGFSLPPVNPNMRPTLPSVKERSEEVFPKKDRPSSSSSSSSSDSSQSAAPDKKNEATKQTGNNSQASSAAP